MIETTLAELDEVLRAASPGVAVRELRVRHAALARVVRGWALAEPYTAQLAAMRECVAELRDAVKKACPQGPREAAAGSGGASRPPARPTRRAIPVKSPMKSSGPPPRRSSGGAGLTTTRPPPRRDAGGSSPPSSRRG